MFGHFTELLGLLVVGLLVFGPKRMIEMGSSFGKAFREFKEATKELDWPGLSGLGGSERPSPLAKLSQFTQSLSGEANPPSLGARPPAPDAVEGLVGYLQQQPQAGEPSIASPAPASDVTSTSAPTPTAASAD